MRVLFIQKALLWVVAIFGYHTRQRLHRKVICELSELPKASYPHKSFAWFQMRPATCQIKLTTSLSRRPLVGSFDLTAQLLKYWSQGVTASITDSLKGPAASNASNSHIAFYEMRLWRIWMSVYYYLLSLLFAVFLTKFEIKALWNIY